MEAKELIEQYKALKETKEILQAKLDGMEISTASMEENLEEQDILKIEIDLVQRKMKMCKNKMYKKLLENDDEYAKLFEQREKLQAKLEPLQENDNASPEEIDNIKNEIDILDSKLKNKDELIQLIAKELGVSKDEILGEVEKIKQERIERQKNAEKLVKEMEEKLQAKIPQDATVKSAPEQPTKQQTAIHTIPRVGPYKTTEVPVQSEKQAVAQNQNETTIPNEKEGSNLPIKSRIIYI